MHTYTIGCTSPQNPNKKTKKTTSCTHNHYSQSLSAISCYKTKMNGTAIIRDAFVYTFV